MIRLSFLFLFFYFVFAPQVVFAEEWLHDQVDVYDEINNKTLNLTRQSMMMVEDATKGFLVYTATLQVPGTKESAVAYFYDSKHKRLSWNMYYRFGQGPPVETNRALDVMIESRDSFFVVELPGGMLGYIRDGRFEIDHTGRLVSLAWGFPILGENGYIYLKNSTKKSVIVTREGAIVSDGNVVDVLKIVGVKNRQDLLSFNQSIFFLPENKRQSGLCEPTYKVLQGYIEDTSITKGQVGQVGEFKNLFESNVKVMKAYLHGLSGAIQLANPQ